MEDADDLSLVYSPGVAESCIEIYLYPDKIYDYTIKGNLVAVVSDGSAVLGLGNIGPGAAMPFMGRKKAALQGRGHFCNGKPGTGNHAGRGN
ncbi:hypothetical protein [Peribacillus sp. NPDC096540]|uniref:hypothetical protein n=1 Tax=Peribacillus sp. NPDC096540 TaxID=3390612 RepID=UPI003CFC2B9E